MAWELVGLKGSVAAAQEASCSAGVYAVGIEDNSASAVPVAFASAADAVAAGSYIVVEVWVYSSPASADFD